MSPPLSGGTGVDGMDLGPAPASNAAAIGGPRAWLDNAVATGVGLPPAQDIILVASEAAPATAIR